MNIFNLEIVTVTPDFLNIIQENWMLIKQFYLDQSILMTIYKMIPRSSTVNKILEMISLNSDKLRTLFNLHKF